MKGLVGRLLGLTPILLVILSVVGGVAFSSSGDMSTAIMNTVTAAAGNQPGTVMYLSAGRGELMFLSENKGVVNTVLMCLQKCDSHEVYLLWKASVYPQYELYREWVSSAVGWKRIYTADIPNGFRVLIGAESFHTMMTASLARGTVVAFKAAEVPFAVLMLPASTIDSMLVPSRVFQNHPQ